ncbi:MAG: GAP family protein [bacterium]|nr:GAP family protein [bacterium]
MEHNHNHQHGETCGTEEHPAPARVSKTLLAIGGVLLVFFGGLILLKGSSFGTELLWNASQGGSFLLPLVVISALLDSINPCAFSVLIITLLFLFSLGLSRRRILLVGGLYILGIFAAYFLIGLGLLQALHVFGIPHFMGKVGAVLMLLFGVLLVIQELFPKVHIPLGIPQSAHAKMGALMHRASLPAAFLLGALVGLCEFPCTGGPYLMILGLLHDGATYLKGFGYLLLYNVIFTLPLVVLLAASANKEAVEVAQKIRKGEFKQARLVVALLMVLLGALVIWFY